MLEQLSRDLCVVTDTVFDIYNRNQSYCGTWLIIKWTYENAGSGSPFHLKLTRFYSFAFSYFGSVLLTERIIMSQCNVTSVSVRRQFTTRRFGDTGSLWCVLFLRVLSVCLFVVLTLAVIAWDWSKPALILIRQQNICANFLRKPTIRLHSSTRETKY